MNFDWLKRLMPRGLYGRAALILFLPVVVVTLVVTVMFLQRHFEDVTRQMVRSAAAELALIADRVEGAADIEEALASGATITEAVKNPDIRAFGVCLVLAIAWSASMGGLGTLLGSPPNAIVAGYARDELIGRPFREIRAPETRAAL